jgi:hypothetical protein
VLLPGSAESHLAFLIGRFSGHCEFCLTGWETLCKGQDMSGYSVNGSFAEFALGQADYLDRIPDKLSFTRLAHLVLKSETVSAGLPENLEVVRERTRTEGSHRVSLRCTLRTKEHFRHGRCANCLPYFPVDMALSITLFSGRSKACVGRLWQSMQSITRCSPLSICCWVVSHRSGQALGHPEEKGSRYLATLTPPNPRGPKCAPLGMAIDRGCATT